MVVDVPRRENKHVQWWAQRATEHDVRCAWCVHALLEDDYCLNITGMPREMAAHFSHKAAKAIIFRALQLRPVKSKLGDAKHTPPQTHNLPLVLFLSKTGQNSKEVRMCRNWFWINYFRLNLHLIIEILAHICWRSEFIIARPLCWEITRNNAVNYSWILSCLW